MTAKPFKLCCSIQRRIVETRRGPQADLPQSLLLGHHVPLSALIVSGAAQHFKNTFNFEIFHRGC